MIIAGMIMDELRYEGGGCWACSSNVLSMADIYGADGYIGSLRLCRTCFNRWLSRNGAVMLRDGRAIVEDTAGDRFIIAWIERRYDKAASKKIWNMHVRYLNRCCRGAARK